MFHNTKTGQLVKKGEIGEYTNKSRSREGENRKVETGVWNDHTSALVTTHHLNTVVKCCWATSQVLNNRWPHSPRTVSVSFGCQKPPTFIAATWLDLTKPLSNKPRGWKLLCVTKEATRYLAISKSPLTPGVNWSTPGWNRFYWWSELTSVFHWSSSFFKWIADGVVYQNAERKLTAQPRHK